MSPDALRGERAMTDDRPIQLEAVDRVEITIVVDNFIDVLMAGSDGVRRYVATDWGEGEQLIAEHGFSALVTVEARARRSSLLYDGGLTPTTQVERRTEFENGFPIHYARSSRGWEADPMIWDDQNLIVNVKDKGLVIVSGCSHAGAVNVLRNAQRLTGEERVAGFVGGFHLTGGIFEILRPRGREHGQRGSPCTDVFVVVLWQSPPSPWWRSQEQSPTPSPISAAAG
jgi:metal-dependent hydrolase (beta-lactamase superfamily II)